MAEIIYPDGLVSDIYKDRPVYPAVDCYIDAEEYDPSQDKYILFIRVPYQSETESVSLSLYFDNEDSDYVGQDGTDAFDITWESADNCNITEHYTPSDGDIDCTFPSFTMSGVTDGYVIAGNITAEYQCFMLTINAVGVRYGNIACDIPAFTFISSVSSNFDIEDGDINHSNLLSEIPLMSCEMITAFPFRLAASYPPFALSMALPNSMNCVFPEWKMLATSSQTWFVIEADYPAFTLESYTLYTDIKASYPAFSLDSYSLYTDLVFSIPSFTMSSSGNHIELFTGNIEAVYAPMTLSCSGQPLITINGSITSEYPVFNFAAYTTQLDKIAELNISYPFYSLSLTIQPRGRLEALYPAFELLLDDGISAGIQASYPAVEMAGYTGSVVSASYPAFEFSAETLNGAVVQSEYPVFEMESYSGVDISAEYPAFAIDMQAEIVNSSVLDAYILPFDINMQGRFETPIDITASYPYMTCLMTGRKENQGDISCKYPFYSIIMTAPLSVIGNINAEYNMFDLSINGIYERYLNKDIIAQYPMFDIDMTATTSDDYGILRHVRGLER